MAKECCYYEGIVEKIEYKKVIFWNNNDIYVFDLENMSNELAFRGLGKSENVICSQNVSFYF